MTKLLCMCSVSYTNSLHGVDLVKAFCQCRSREIGSLSVCQSVGQLVSWNTVCFFFNNNFLKTNKALRRKHLILIAAHDTSILLTIMAFQSREVGLPKLGMVPGLCQGIELLMPRN